MSNIRLKFQRSLLFGLLICAAPAFAQNSVLLSEGAARLADARDAGSLLEDGDNAYLDNDYKLAIDKYAEALSKLPKGAKSVVGLRATVVQRFFTGFLGASTRFDGEGRGKEGTCLG